MASILSPFWYTLEDLLEQSWAMQAFIAWGWLSVVIMLLSFGEGLINYLAA